MIQKMMYLYYIYQPLYLLKFDKDNTNPFLDLAQTIPTIHEKEGKLENTLKISKSALSVQDSNMLEMTQIADSIIY